MINDRHGMTEKLLYGTLITTHKATKTINQQRYFNSINTNASNTSVAKTIVTSYMKAANNPIRLFGCTTGQLGMHFKERLHEKMKGRF